MPVAREKLYEEVWAEPMTTVAKRYGVSSSFLARVCERLKVPRPPPGYWAQLAVGRAEEQPALPEALPGDVLEWSRKGEPRAKQKPLGTHPKAPRKRVGERPAQHPILSGAKAAFEKSRPPGFLKFSYLRPFKHLLVDIWVSKECLERALDVANQVFLALEDRGHRVEIALHGSEFRRPDVDEREKSEGERYAHRDWRPSRATVVYIDGVALGLTLFELSENVETEWVNGKYVRASTLSAAKRARLGGSAFKSTHDVPSGRLCLRATSPYRLATWEQQWRESSAGDLVAKLPKIVRELEQAAKGIPPLLEEGQRQADERQKEWELQREKLRAQEAERRRKEAEARQEKDLRDHLERWRLARDVREFVGEIRRVVEVADLEITEGGKLDRYIRVAEALVERMDPLRELKADIARVVAKASQAASSTPHDAAITEQAAQWWPCTDFDDAQRTDNKAASQPWPG